MLFALVECTHLSLRGTSTRPISARRHSLHSCHLLHLRQHALPHPQINQWLHGLRVLLREQTVQPSAVDEVHEARVELAVAARVPEEEPVLPVEVGVAAEHLLVPYKKRHVSACDRKKGRLGGVVHVHVLNLRLEPLREA